MPTMSVSPYNYKFEDETLFTNVSYSPNINNVKNDFSVWGTRKTDGGEVAIHTRYAIDKKPNKYTSFSGITYTSDQYDWRELIYQMALDYQKYNQTSNYYSNLVSNNPDYVSGKTGYEQYYSDLLGFWRQLYNPLITDNDKLIQETGGFSYYLAGEQYQYWNKQIHLSPTSLNFWFDFLDNNSEFDNYSVKKIGTRSKSINEASINSIYFKETPEVLFIVSPVDKFTEISTAHTPIQIQDNMANLFYKSAQGVSAITKTNELINQHTVITETMNITAIPIYYLEPNTRIYIANHGDYTLDKITYGLAYSGTMTISGNKIVQQLY